MIQEKKPKSYGGNDFKKDRVNNELQNFSYSKISVKRLSRCLAKDEEKTNA